MHIVICVQFHVLLEVSGGTSALPCHLENYRIVGFFFRENPVSFERWYLVVALSSYSLYTISHGLGLLATISRYPLSVV